MEIAYSTIEKSPVSIHVFCKKSDAEIEKLRRSLLCPKCEVKAWFRKKSKDGKSACFNAYHAEGCTASTQKHQIKNNTEVVEDVRQIITNNDTVDLNFVVYSSPIADGENTFQQSLTIKNVDSASSRHSITPAIERNQTRRLSSILKLLTGSEDFAKSNIKIDTGPPAKHPYYARNLFVSFDAIIEEHIGKWRGFWGVISHANEEVTWLNIANSLDVSIPISAIKAYLLKTFRIMEAEDLAGAQVLVFGYLNVSKTKAKKYFIKLRNNNPAHIFLKLDN